MRIAILLVAASVISPASLLTQDGGVANAAGSITPADYIRRLGIIAHDSMAGRDTPSRGLDLTAAWVAREFERFGLAPGGDGESFIQRYPLRELRLDVAQSGISLDGGTMWRAVQDVVKLFGPTELELESDRVVVVSGQDELRREDLEQAVVFVVTPTDGDGRITSAGQRLLLGAFRQNAAAVIGIADVADSVWARYERRTTRATIARPEPSGRAGRAILIVRDATVSDALARHGFDLAAARATSPGAAQVLDIPITITLRPLESEGLSAPNTVGILEGGDPQLKNEYVVFSAHMDHVGTSSGGRCQAAGADTICNGADDDASGTVGIVQLARAFTLLNPRPRRSIIFLTVSGEERGLWGSAYFATHPPVPVDQMVANVNADMIGRNWTDTVVVIGKEHSDLGATLNRVNAAHPELNMTAIDDIWPNERFYFRSDHYNFARRGVPVLFFFNGTHPQYHRPTDHVELIDEEKASRIVKLVFYLGLEIANAAERPKWNPESYRQIVEEGR